MRHYLLTYTLAPDYLERRPLMRQAHLEHARAAVARGELVLGGALSPPVAAVLLFRADSAAIAEDFASRDPYVTQGLASGWTVREWATVVGAQALTPP